MLADYPFSFALLFAAHRHRHLADAVGLISIGGVGKIQGVVDRRHLASQLFGYLLFQIGGEFDHLFINQLSHIRILFIIFVDHIRRFTLETVVVLLVRQCKYIELLQYIQILYGNNYIKMERKIDRLDFYMKFSGLNDNKITAETGLTVGVIGKSRKEGRDLSAKAMELILTKYPDLNPDWLLTGEGEMIRPAKNPFSQMTEQEIGEVTATVRAEEWIRRYEAGEIFPAEIHHRIMAEKDKQIAELQRRVWDLEQQVKELTK